MSSVDALVKLVWSENPNKLIVYKPHPDVLSGNRKGLAASNNYCHIVDAESDIISLIESVDEVHTLSSLAGLRCTAARKESGNLWVAILFWLGFN